MAKTPRQPDPEPLEVDDVLIVSIGIVVLLIAGCVLLGFWHHLKATGHLWWIASCFSGAGLGAVFGLPAVIRRRSRLRSGLKR